MTTLSIIQDSLKQNNVSMALSVTEEKLKKLGTLQTMAIISPPTVS